MKILRTIGILVLVAGLALGGAGSALAQDGEPELAEVKGVIEAVNTEADKVTILSEEEETVILTITGETEIKKDGVTATIEDLAKDDEVEALYNPGTLEAVKIVAKSPEPAENGGPAGGSPEPGLHSPGKRGLFGTVDSVSGYDVTLVTKEGLTVVVTLTETARYMVPRETKGPKDLATFLTKVGDPPAIVGRRIAVLVTFTTEFEADAIRLMLIPSPGSSPSWGHRVGVVEDGAFDPSTGITIIDREGVSHYFTVSEDTVYRPSAEDGGISELAGDALKEAIEEGCVTVVTKGDPKLPDPIAKAIVLHDELPDWALD